MLSTKKKKENDPNGNLSSPDEKKAKVTKSVKSKDASKGDMVKPKSRKDHETKKEIKGSFHYH